MTSGRRFGWVLLTMKEASLRKLRIVGVRDAIYSSTYTHMFLFSSGKSTSKTHYIELLTTRKHPTAIPVDGLIQRPDRKS